MMTMNDKMVNDKMLENVAGGSGTFVSKYSIQKGKVYSCMCGEVALLFQALTDDYEVYNGGIESVFHTSTTRVKARILQGVTGVFGKKYHVLGTTEINLSRCTALREKELDASILG